ncbi:uberolysin/carnocyclin family circular bacteriocin, partial [Bacillus sp. MM2020_4]
AANLGISTTVAGKVITVIDTFSTITTIISLVAIIVGYGVISTALVITAKKIISKYGKGYATTW